MDEDTKSQKGLSCFSKAENLEEEKNEETRIFI